MGWLRDLMQAAVPPVKSFGELARRVLRTKHWPDNPRPKPRSLAALFSKFDRQQELDWLADRLPVQVALANALGCSVGDLGRWLGPNAPSVTAGLLRLSDVPYARSLDLTREPLCPGLPRDVLLPSAWRLSWWYAPPGSGRGLLCAWLEARSACHVIRTDSLADAIASCPSHGPVLLSVDRPGALPPRLSLPSQVCVVAPFTPETLQREQQLSEALARYDWQLVTSPPPGNYLEELVEWVGERLPNDGHFDRKLASDWLTNVALRQGWLDSLSTTLGLCGALDEVDLRKLGSPTREALSAEFFKQRLRHASSHDTTAVSWLRRQGLSVLVGMFMRLLVEANGSWQEPRSFDEWLSLVPLEHQREADVDWMRLVLSEKDSPVRPGDITAVAKQIPPGAFRVIQALQQQLLLRPTQAGLLQLGPRWFAAGICQMARQRLLEASALEWGEALLNPAEAPHMFDTLLDRIGLHDFGPLEAVLELETDQDPASVAAVEAAFVCAGFGLLSGVEVPQDLIENLWHEQERLLVDFKNGLPTPRVLFLERHSQLNSTRWFGSGSFYLAALAVSEQVPRGLGRKRALLNPWSEASPPPLLERLYDDIQGSLEHGALPRPLQHAGFALVDRLRNAVGQCRTTPHPLELPGIVLDEAQHEVLTGSRLAALLNSSGLMPLSELANLRHLEWSTVAGALWTAWNDADSLDAAVKWLRQHPEHEPDMFAAVPGQVLVKLLSENGAALPFQHFADAQWSVFVQTLDSDSPSAAPRAAWRAIPAEFASTCLDVAATKLDLHALSELWLRLPELVLEHLREHALRGQVEAAVHLAVAAPERHAEALADCLNAHLKLSDLGSNHLDRVRRWLVACVSRRQAGWRAAYTLLCQIEEALAPLRAAQRA